MCFSASASFGAGAALIVIGVASLKKSSNQKEKAFASIPLLFGIQQISEGFLWLALSDPDFAGLREFTTYTFLFCAQVLWPTWVPLSIFLIEKKPGRKKILAALLSAGLLVSIYLAYCLINYPVAGSIVGYHIHYQQDYPATISLYGGILYVLATIGPVLISSVKRMWMLGLAILISYIMTTLLYPDYIVSVWCFFAAVISFTVLVVMYGLKKDRAKKND